MMKASDVYEILGKMFDVENPTDDWHGGGACKGKDMGLMVDNATEINKVYTVTFLNSEVIKLLKKSQERNALVFCHHPQCWDMERLLNTGELFKELADEEYQFLKDNKISVYLAHHPLDDNKSQININKSLAKAIDIEIVENHVINYGGISSGVICKVKDMAELKTKFEKAIGHKSHLLSYGNGEIKNALVAITTSLSRERCSSLSFVIIGGGNG